MGCGGRSCHARPPTTAQPAAAIRWQRPSASRTGHVCQPQSPPSTPARRAARAASWYHRRRQQRNQQLVHSDALPTYNCLNHSHKNSGQDAADVHALGRGLRRHLEGVAGVLHGRWRCGGTTASITTPHPWAWRAPRWLQRRLAAALRAPNAAREAALLKPRGPMIIMQRFGCGGTLAWQYSEISGSGPSAAARGRLAAQTRRTPMRAAAQGARHGTMACGNCGWSACPKAGPDAAPERGARRIWYPPLCTPRSPPGLMHMHMHAVTHAWVVQLQCSSASSAGCARVSEPSHNAWGAELKRPPELALVTAPPPTWRYRTIRRATAPLPLS